MKVFPPDPMPGMAISARQSARFGAAVRDSHLTGAPGMVLSGVPGASALSLIESYDQNEWSSPYPYGPRWPFGVAFRSGTPLNAAPRVRVFPGVLRRRLQHIVTATTNLTVSDAYRWIVAIVAGNTATVAMWDEACDYTAADYGLSTIHDKNNFIYVPICGCAWVETDDDPPKQWADIHSWQGCSPMLPVY